MTFSSNQLSCDDFLDGKVRIWQPLDGYRAATDPVFLAASIGAKPKQKVLELGCGAGTALLCLAARIPGLSLHGVDVQEAYAELARRNGQENGTALNITCCDIMDMPLELRDQIFDEVLTNPPFFMSNSTANASDSGRDIARREGQICLEDWIDIGLKRTAPLGHFTLIHKAERLAEIISALHTRAGDITIKPISARASREAGRVIVRARKGARGPLRLLPPLVVHEGDKHHTDGDDYSDEARDILRKGVALRS